MNNPLKSNEQETLRDIGEQVARLRGDRSQRWLADHVGTTQTSIRRLERGETNVSSVLLARTAKVLGLEIKDLLAPIETEETMVDITWEKNKKFIKEKISGMGLTVEDFYTKREILRLLDLWPR